MLNYQEVNDENDRRSPIAGAAGGDPGRGVAPPADADAPAEPLGRISRKKKRH